ncbi:MAG: CDP-alcohol phosphatidyltransferase family protein [Firmicutes bacterium]|nr:CDP-alcohol phosphatidyltransferase family protein [Bacillota bacterium]
MFNLPNGITLIRILLVPVFLMVFWSPKPNHITSGMLVLAAAGITDILDGYLARKLNMITPVGKILDPAADKLMLITVMSSLYLVGKIPLWLVVLVILKEAFLVLGGLVLIIWQKTGLCASFYGKAATISVYAALFSGAFEVSGSTIFAALAGLVSILALTEYINIFIRRFF